MLLTRLAAVLVLGGGVLAQCALTVQPGQGVPGLDGEVHAVLEWDPDGNGPAPARLVAGGSFALAGSTFAQNIAAFDPSTGQWSALGTGTNGAVYALAQGAGGELFVGGLFMSAGGIPAARIARWDGSSWAPLFYGADAPVLALAVLPNGDLVAGGSFTYIGGVVTTGVARWNGAAWSALGTGIAGGVSPAVWSLMALPNGDVVAGGRFTVAGGSPANSIATWNGIAWMPMGGGVSGLVAALARLPGGDIVAAGGFLSAGGIAANHIAKWNGTAWSPLGAGVDSPGVAALAVLPSGMLVVGGGFTTAGGVFAPRLVAWDGANWSHFAGGVSDGVQALCLAANGDLVVGGLFRNAGAAPVSTLTGACRIARWNGTAWTACGSGTNDFVARLDSLSNGDAVAIGWFSQIGGASIQRLARWDGASWVAFGSGIGNAIIHAIVELPGGDLVAGGHFTSIGGTPANKVARWNGTAWAAMGAGLSSVRSLGLHPNGDVLAGGIGNNGGVHRWNGVTWSPVGNMTGQADVLAVLPDGSILACGVFIVSAQPLHIEYLQRWNGSTWTFFAPPPGGGPVDLLVLANGDLLASGGFGMARWDGVAWSLLGGGMSGPLGRFVRLPNGDLIAIRGTNELLRWDGASWTVVTTTSDSVVDLALSRDRLLIGGNFQSVGGTLSAFVASLATTCPAAAQSSGAGCGGDALVAGLPWTGGTWRADASGLPNTALVLAVTGFATTSLPLSAVFTTALPGCTLHTQPDFIDVQLANGGTASFELALPNTPSLAGVVFHHQMVALDLAPAQTVTATNALSLTVGSF